MSAAATPRTLRQQVEDLLAGREVVLWRVGPVGELAAWFALTPEDAAAYTYRHGSEPRAYRVRPARVVDARDLGTYVADLAARTRPTCCRETAPCDSWCRDAHTRARYVLGVRSIAEHAEAVIDAEDGGTAVLHEDLVGDREHLSVLLVLPDDDHVTEIER